jgi:hypothetical protein
VAQTVHFNNATHFISSHHVWRCKIKAAFSHHWNSQHFELHTQAPLDHHQNSLQKFRTWSHRSTSVLQFVIQVIFPFQMAVPAMHNLLRLTMSRSLVSDHYLEGLVLNLNVGYWCLILWTNWTKWVWKIVSKPPVSIWIFQRNKSPWDNSQKLELKTPAQTWFSHCRKTPQSQKTSGAFSLHKAKKWERKNVFNFQ